MSVWSSCIQQALSLVEVDRCITLKRGHAGPHLHFPCMLVFCRILRAFYHATPNFPPAHDFAKLLCPSGVDLVPDVGWSC